VESDCGKTLLLTRSSVVESGHDTPRGSGVLSLRDRHKGGTNGTCVVGP